MNADDLLRAMSQVDERYIQEAEAAVLSKPKLLWVRWAAAAAACLAVVFAVALGNTNRTEQLTQDGSSMEMATWPAGFWEDLILQAPEETIAPAWAETAAEPKETNSAPADVIVEEPGMDQTPDMEQVPQSPPEWPSVVVRITQWRENGFEAVVERITSTYIFSLGTKLSVVFSQNMAVVDQNGEMIHFNGQKPTQEDLPVGSVVEIQFRMQEDGPLLVETLWKEDSL